MFELISSKSSPSLKELLMILPQGGVVAYDAQTVTVSTLAGLQKATASLAFSSNIPYLRKKRSTRPSVSIIFCVPV